MKTNDLPEPTKSVEEEISQLAVGVFRSTKGAKLGYLCRYCAVALGGEWPEHHVATTHNGECSVCLRDAGVVAPSDWQLNEDGRRYKVSSLEWD